jgi:hypothetical protein
VKVEIKDIYLKIHMYEAYAKNAPPRAGSACWAASKFFFFWQTHGTL